MNLDKILESRALKLAIVSMVVFIAFAFVFGCGIYIGTERANFAYKWAEQYHENFAGPEKGFMENVMDRKFTESSGVIGEIIKIGDNMITVRGNDNLEKNILISKNTKIVKQKNNVPSDKLKIGDIIVVIGEPTNKGQINAQLIRIVPIKPTSRGRAPVNTTKQDQINKEPANGPCQENI